jgi:putative flippase GtrA
MRLLRSFVAGAAATLVDLAVLALLVSILRMAPSVANVPALVAGGIVSFVGNRHYAFRAAGGPLVRHALGYGAVEFVALVLNGVLFDVAMRALPGHPDWYAAVRLVTSHVVFLAWSYPLWRFVFRPVARTLPCS